MILKPKIAARFLFVFQIFFAKGLRKEILLLQNLQMQHPGGKQNKYQMNRVKNASKRPRYTKSNPRKAGFRLKR